MKISRLNTLYSKITLMSVVLLSTISAANLSTSKTKIPSFPLSQKAVADTVSSANPSYTISGTVGSFTILKSTTLIGTGTSTSGFVANSKEVDTSAPTMTSGSGTVSVSGTYSGSSLAISSGSNKGTYAANWGSASSLVTTGGYVVTGLTVGSSFNKTWSDIGTLNGKSLNVTMTFTVTALQNASGTNNYIAVSNNLNTFVTSNNINGKFQVQYTYADGTPLSLSDMNQLAFLGGSLTPATEYMTTADASDVLLSSNSSVPTAVKGATNANATSLGLADGMNTLFYSPTSSYTVSDTDFNSYGYAYGASFLNFSKATPTIYFGNWTASTGKISAQGANHILFATETSPISVSRLLTASGDSDYTIVSPANNVVLKNTLSPSVLNDNSTATITKAVASSITGPDGKTYPATNVTVDTAGNVTVDKSIFTKAGNYTLTVTYTDSTGAIVTAYDNISVAVGTNAITPVATPITVKNTNVPKGTPTISVTGPDGSQINSSAVSLATQGSDGLVTLAGQNNSGIYTIDLTYPSGLVVEDYISVAQGDNTTVGLNKTATVQNEVTKILGQNATNNGNVINNPVLNLASGVVGTISAPSGVTVNPKDVSVNSDGSVSLKGQSVPGIYTIPVTYTETYTDATGQQVTMAVTVNDVITIVENQIPGFEVSMVEGSSITGSNDLTDVDTGILGLFGAAKANVELISATENNSDKTPITTGLNGSPISASDFKVGQNLLEILTGGYTGEVTASDNLSAGDYLIKVTYTGQDGVNVYVNDIVHVYAKPKLSSDDKTIMVGDTYSDRDTFTGGTDSLGNSIDYDTAVENGSLVVTDNVNTSKAGNYSVTYTYTDPTTQVVTTSRTKVQVLASPTLQAPTIPDTNVSLSVSTSGAKITDDSQLGNGKVTSTSVIGPDGNPISLDSDGNFVPKTAGIYKVTYTYDYKKADGTKASVSTSTTVNVGDQTIISSKTTSTIPIGTYDPSIDYLSSKNADGTAGTFNQTNGAKVTVTITDKNGKTVTANTDGTYTLPAGSYIETYSVTDSKGNNHTSTTSLISSDLTAINSKPTDTLESPAPGLSTVSYNPTDDFISSVNADGSDGSFNQTNQAKVTVSITDGGDENGVGQGNVIKANADGTYTLSANHRYTEIYSVTDTSGHTISSTTQIAVPHAVADPSLLTSKPTDTISAGPYQPKNDLSKLTNGDDSDGLSSLILNNNPIHVSITDESGQIIFDNDLTDKTKVNLPAGSYNVTYTGKDLSGNKIISTTTLIVTDQTNISSKNTDQVSVGTYNPVSDFTSSKNADGTTGSLTDTNGTPVQITISDQSGKTVTANAEGAYNLTGGDYKVTYSVKNSNGNLISTTTQLSVSDNTAISSKTNDSLPIGSDYKPSTDFVNSTNADGTDGSASNTNGDKVQVQITDKNGKVIWTGTIDDTVSTKLLSQGQYKVTYSVLNSNKKAIIATTSLIITGESTISSKNSIINVGEKWSAADNFTGGTDSSGNSISLSDVTVSSKVSTTKGGQYEVTYTYTNPISGQKVTTKATVTVVDNTAISSRTKDSLISGSDFVPKDDYLNSTNADKTSGKLTDTNGAKVALVITDGNQKTIYSGDADKTVPASKLPVGTYQVTYSVTDTNGKVKSSQTTLQVIGLDQTDLITKSTDTVPAGSYDLSKNYISSVNTDESKGNLTNTNGKPVQVTISDQTGKVIYEGPASHALTLTGGSYNLIYTVENASGKKITSSTQLTVTDSTSVQSKSTDKINASQPYSPSKDFISATNSDNTDGSLPSTNGNPIKISISDKTGQIISPNADGTYTLNGGSYTETYTVIDSNGNAHTSTTILSSQDLTSITSKPNVTTNAPAAGQTTVPFDPAIAFETSTNSDGSKGNLNNTNGNNIKVTVTGKNGQIIPANPDNTYSLVPNENYTVTYKTQNSTGTEITSTTEVNVPNAIIDNTNLKSNKTDNINVGTYNPVSDLTAIKNADGTDGIGKLILNNKTIHVTITDENGKLILDNDLSATPSVKLSAGTYVVTYKGVDLLNNSVITTTIVNVSDQTALVSKAVNNELKANQTYRPSTDLLTDKNADETDGTISNTNDTPLKITVTDKNGKVITGSSDGTYKLPAGSYTVTYTAIDSTGKDVTTMTQINISDKTSIDTKASSTITDGNDFDPKLSLIKTSNADGTDGNIINTNGNPIKVILTDKNGKTIYEGNAKDLIPANILTAGDYTLTYLISNSNGQIVSNTTNLTVQPKKGTTPPDNVVTDQTSLTSKNSDKIIDGNSYNPEIDLIKATDKFGNSISSSDISVTIADKNNKTIWTGSANATVSAKTLTLGDYLVTYKYHDKSSVSQLIVSPNNNKSNQNSLKSENITNKTVRKVTPKNYEQRNNQQNLPKTGSQSSNFTSLVGLILLSLASLFKLLKNNRSRN